MVTRNGQQLRRLKPILKRTHLHVIYIYIIDFSLTLLFLCILYQILKNVSLKFDLKFISLDDLKGAKALTKLKNENAIAIFLIQSSSPVESEIPRTACFR